MTNAIFTAYCACTICCGPNASNITAAGSKPIQGITVAASRKYPLNTPIYIHIPGVVNNKRYLISDRLSLKYDNRIDIYFTTHNKAKQFGVKKGYIWIPKKKSK